jgi:uncharacterized membrane protein
MKKLTMGIFNTRENAESAIRSLHDELGIPTDDISYVYRNSENEVKEVNLTEGGEEGPAEGAVSGAVTGGTIGALAGIATVIGIIPVIGPIFAAGPLLAALGIGAGAVGTTAAAAVTGAAAGGLIGALANLGVSSDKAKEYEDRVYAGDILVAVHAEENYDVAAKLSKHGATSVDSYAPAI